MAAQCHVRSVSFPSRSHPSTNAVEQELNSLRTWEVSSSASTSVSICTGLSGLDDLHRCVDDLLKMKSTQQILSRIQNQKYVDLLLDGSLRILDACNTTRDVMLEIKEHCRVLQSALRRRKGDLSVEQGISSYSSFRKKMKKEAKRLKGSLNRITNKKIEVVEQDSHLLSVIRVLDQVNSMNISVFQTVLAFLSSSAKSKQRQNKWSVVSKLMHKGKVGIQEKEEITGNEIEMVDSLLSKFASCDEEDDSQKKQNLQKSLEALEIEIEGIENCVECVFRRLIKTRASLLNIISN